MIRDITVPHCEKYNLLEYVNQKLKPHLPFLAPMPLILSTFSSKCIDSPKTEWQHSLSLQANNRYDSQKSSFYKTSFMFLCLTKHANLVKGGPDKKIQHIYNFLGC